MKSKFLSIAVALTACFSLGLIQFANAATPASTTVTIKANGDVGGRVKSSKPKKCADGRKIILIQQMGAQQDPSVDEKTGLSDTASKSGDHYEWSLGQPGLAAGKYYAKAKKIPGKCKGDRSKTVTVS
ncbi:MAG: hypothetical protein GEU71_00900 [Actinobacteria bacterium]|nr:hypothetical protein [Actinomycetota bacterium]